MISKLERIKLRRVHFIPKELEPGYLYVSEEFDAAVHLCACGCKTKVSTPLGPTGWTVRETPEGPTLEPSVGNWQIPCQSHYWIKKGNVKWGDTWTFEQIKAGRENEEERRQEYYQALERKRRHPLSRIWRWIRGFFK